MQPVFWIGLCNETNHGQEYLNERVSASNGIYWNYISASLNREIRNRTTINYDINYERSPVGIEIFECEFVAQTIIDSVGDEDDERSHKERKGEDSKQEDRDGYGLLLHFW